MIVWFLMQFHIPCKQQGHWEVVGTKGDNYVDSKMMLCEGINGNRAMSTTAFNFICHYKTHKGWYMNKKRALRTSKGGSAWPVHAKNRKQLDNIEVEVTSLFFISFRTALCPAKDLKLPICIHLVICCPFMAPIDDCLRKLVWLSDDATHSLCHFHGHVPLRSPWPGWTDGWTVFLRC